MSFQALISTINQDDISLLDKMKVCMDSVVINQCNVEKRSEYQYNGHKILWIDTLERGLSKSRNMAIREATADICLFCDDDEELLANTESIIINEFDRHKGSSIICFKIQGIEKKFKDYSEQEKKIGYIDSMKISSVEMAFVKKDIYGANISFDEKIGAGTQFLKGEENAFLFSCLKKRLYINYVPVEIAKLHIGESTWFTGFNKHYFYAQGAVFCAMSKLFTLPLILQFCLRKRNLYKDKYSIFNVLRYMLIGKRKYSKTTKANEKKSIFFIGDYSNDNGPSVANKLLRDGFFGFKDVFYSKRNNKIMRIIEMFIAVIKCNSICFCSNSKINLYGIKLCNIFHKNKVYIVHGCISFENSHVNDPLLLSSIKQYEKKIYESMDLIICVSKKCMNNIVMDYPYLSSKIKYVYNSVDIGKIKQFSDGINSIKDHNMILSLGGGVRCKNNYIVCKAIRKLNLEYGMNIKYVVIGAPDPDKKKIVKYDFVEYYDQLSREDVFLLMKRANLYVQNSSFETFGLSPIEALYCGCNLLISNNMGARDLFINVSDDNVILDCENVEEISRKIKKLMSVDNSTQMMNSFDSKSVNQVLNAKKVYGLINRL